MFDVGFTELVLIFVIGLLILGPERLPRVAAQIGRWVSKARRTANQLRHQLEREMALEEINRKKRPPPTSKAADRQPPGDETAGASAPAGAPVSEAGNTASGPSTSTAAGSAESPAASAAPSAPDTGTSDITRVASVEEPTKESTTTNS